MRRVLVKSEQQLQSPEAGTCLTYSRKSKGMSQRRERFEKKQICEEENKRLAVDVMLGIVMGYL